MAKTLAKIVNLLTPKRRWTQFSLFTMFIVVTVFCVWLAWEQSQASRQRRAVKRIKELGGFIRYAHESPDGQIYGKRIPNAEPPGPAWLRRWLGDEYFVTPIAVEFENGQQVANDDLVAVGSLSALQLLHIWHSTELTDSGFVHLRGLHQLRRLAVLDVPQVGDAGLPDLAALTSLKELELFGTKVSDAGLVHLGKLVNLRLLNLRATNVTDAGVDELQKALPNCRIVR